jgi:pimeloyl-ACP methyl ester carboxylesterase
MPQPTPLPGPEAIAAKIGCRFEIVPVGARSGFIMHPAQPAQRPRRWLWHAPVLPNNPVSVQSWYFDHMVSAGIAVAGVDIGESYGNPAGRATFTDFWQTLVRKHGFDKKAMLMPQSRGGLMHYNWAAEHPEAVRCIAGIYTVCDPLSWPGAGHKQLLEAYGMDREQFIAAAPAHTPINRLQPLVAAHIPLLHLHGDNDTVVPLDSNAGALAQRYRELGGACELLVVPGKGHAEIPEFFEDHRVVDFLIAQAKAKN